MNINYKGEFNYEVQSGVDAVPINTDSNRDRIYKKVMEVSQKETEAVMMRVQLVLCSLFDAVSTN